jgi:hypothetical protein
LHRRRATHGGVSTFSSHLLLFLCLGTTKDEWIVPSALPPKLSEWVNERGRRKLPPPLLLVAPFALVVASHCHGGASALPSGDLAVGDTVALVVRLEGKSPSEEAIQDAEEKVKES